ncbi:unnamed protein product, partial [Nesidiocoris tenuis]
TSKQKEPNGRVCLFETRARKADQGFLRLVIWPIICHTVLYLYRNYECGVI